MTEKQHELLSLIADHTRFEGDCTDGAIAQFWVPGKRNDYCSSLNKDIWIDGAGAANCLKGMERKGWIKQQSVGKYSYSITEEGLLQIEKHRERTNFYTH